MSSTIVAPNAGLLVGAQRPRICTYPAYATSSGEEAVDLTAKAGLRLDDWQQFGLGHALGERADGCWAAREVGLMCSRQNGKGGILEAREITGLFLLEERLIVHTAHQFDTSAQHFLRVASIIEHDPELDRRVDKILRGHGNESITLLRNRKTGVAPTIQFRTRTGAGGLGFSIGCLVFDEAMIISMAMHGALLPTLSAMPNIQVWYTGSAVDEQNPSHDGVVFARVRERGIKGDDPALAYMEWSVEGDDPDRVAQTDEAAWAQANPALGIRIPAEHIELEQRSMDRRTFAVQRLGVGAWPRTDGNVVPVIDPEQWAKCIDADSQIVGPVCLGFDTTPDRSFSAICVAGYRADGLPHLEIIEHKRGTGWVAQRVEKLEGDHKIIGTVLDETLAGPVPARLEALHIEFTPISAKEHAQACAAIFDLVKQAALRHLGEPDLTDAIKGAVKRPLGEAWLWSRLNSGVDISVLVAITLALWGLRSLPMPVESQIIDMNEVAREMVEAGEDLSNPYA